MKAYPLPGRRVWLGALGLLSLFAGPLSSQDARLAPGQRLRVSRPGRSVLVGTLLRRSPDTLWVNLTGHGPVSVDLPAGSGIEVSLGRRSRAGTGALVGLTVGAVITTAFLTGFCGGDNLCNGDEQVRAALIFGAPSVALGTGIGFLIRPERWKRFDPATAMGARQGTTLLGMRIAVGLR